VGQRNGGKMFVLILVLIIGMGLFIALYVYNNRKRWEFFRKKRGI
jgi:ABC-type sugar transport system permease subunit